MKKLLLIFTIAAILDSCSKDVPSIPDPANAPAISAVPSHFIQKILIESFTKTFNGQCPKAHLILDSLMKYNPEKVFGVSYHVDDVMADPFIITSNGRNYYDSVFNPSAIYPAGMVNRQLNTFNSLSPDQWAASVYTMLGQIPSCGVALEADKISGSSLTLAVHVGFSEQMFGEYRIHAYIVENQVSSNDSTYDQMNDFSINGSTPDSLLSLYALDDTIHLYSHKCVFRKVVTPAGVEGDIIPSNTMYAGNEYKIYYNVDITGINTANSYILVFVDKYAPVPNGHLIENVQKVSFGDTKDWN